MDWHPIPEGRGTVEGGGRNGQKNIGREKGSKKIGRQENQHKKGGQRMFLKKCDMNV